MREYSIGKVILKEVQRPRKNNLFISPKNIPLAALRTVPVVSLPDCLFVLFLSIVSYILFSRLMKPITHV